jgi:maltodextrin utilization protein YvdJ
VKKYTFTFFYFVFLLFFLAIEACSPTSASKENEKRYFDLASFVQKQIDLLSHQSLWVEKKIYLDGRRQEISTDSINWTKELALFREADLNSPSLVSSYDIKEDKQARTLSYLAKEDRLKVREIQLVLGGDGSIENINIEEVKIVYAENNPLYEISRKMSMKIKNGQLYAYTIQGFQKVVLKDSMVYEINGVIKPKNQ